MIADMQTYTWSSIWRRWCSNSKGIRVNPKKMCIWWSRYNVANNGEDDDEDVVRK